MFTEKALESNQSHGSQTTGSSSHCDLVRSLSQQHDSQHRQIEEDHRAASDFGEAVRHVIPAPDSRSPTEEDSPDNFAARLRNQPENKAVKKPALRHEGG